MAHTDPTQRSSPSRVGPPTVVYKYEDEELDSWDIVIDVPDSFHLLVLIQYIF